MIKQYGLTMKDVKHIPTIVGGTINTLPLISTHVLVDLKQINAICALQTEVEAIATAKGLDFVRLPSIAAWLWLDDIK
jgi:hypothetical protein